MLSLDPNRNIGKIFSCDDFTRIKQESTLLTPRAPLDHYQTHKRQPHVPHKFSHPRTTTHTMGISYYDEIEIEDMAWDEQKGVYHYPCPCGDRFEISRAQLVNYEDVATCPSCSLVIRVVYDPVGGMFFK